MALLRMVPDESPLTPLDLVPAEDRPASPARPWLFTNMVATLDGATAFDGLSGDLGDDDDRAMFRSLRAAADVILVASRTANVEQYRPPQRSDDVVRTRVAHGRAERPLIAVVSASLSIDPDLELFADASYRPLILTVDGAPSEQRSRLEAVADVVSLPSGDSDRVDLGAAMRHLAAAGHRTVLSEGGPSLNGQLVADDLIDEWNLTIAPALVSGDAARAAHGAEVPDLRRFDLDRCWRGERALFCRWIRSSDQPPATRAAAS